MVVHYAGRPYGIIDVYKLMTMVKDLVPVDIPISDLKVCLSKKTLWDNEDGSQVFTPMDVIEKRVESPEHWQRIQECDTSYPILVFEEVKNSTGFSTRLKNQDDLKNLYDLDILDGNHRVAQRLIFNYSTVKAVKVPWSIVEKCLITKGASVYTYSRVNSISGRTKK